jgi:ClpP class serine protease
MNNHVILSALLSQEWAILPDNLLSQIRLAESVALDMPLNPEPENAPQAASAGKPLAGTRTVRLRSGVAILPIVGPIYRTSNIFSYFFGGATMDVISADFEAALADADVKAIVFDLHTPGGEITGVNEFVNRVYAARGIKPIIAYSSGFTCSAGYWIASAADEIVADATSLLGSIGVIMPVHKGDKEYDIVSSQSPYKLLDPTKDAHRKRIQKTVDAIADVFVASVARNRGVSKKKVLSDYGKGDVLVGVDAVNAGLADRIGSIDSIIAELNGTAPAAATKSKTPTAQTGLANNTSGAQLDKSQQSKDNTPNPHPTGRTKMSWLTALLGREPTEAERAQALNQLGLEDAAPTHAPAAQGIVSPVSTPLAGLSQQMLGTGLTSAERDELERLRKADNDRASSAMAAARATAQNFGVEKARNLLRAGKIQPVQEKPLAQAFENLALLAATPGIDAALLNVNFNVVDAEGRTATGSASIADLFASALEGAEIKAAGWTQEQAPVVGVDALFNRSTTPAANSGDPTAPQPVDMERVKRMVGSVNPAAAAKIEANGAPSHN